MPQPSARDRFFDALRSSVHGQMLTKLTLGKYRGSEVGLKNLFVRPVQLKSGPHLSFIWRYATRDVTKNHAAEEALAQLERLIGTDFLDAHLFTPAQTAQLETTPEGESRVSIKLATLAPGGTVAHHDREKQHALDARVPWLRDLGITNERGQPLAGCAPKLRQIQRFAELLQHLLAEAKLDERSSIRIADMGAGKGYLTFAMAELLGPRAIITGYERRAELVDSANAVAQRHGMTQLSFAPGEIANVALDDVDVLVALHACDTATDDALARGVAARAALLVVSPCCQKELRPQLIAPAMLAPVLRHGIFHERQSEFITDAMRALALEAVGYRTKVFEFISTEHTAKNLMLAAIRQRSGPDPAARAQLADLAMAYGVSEQRLARHLDLPLSR